MREETFRKLLRSIKSGSIPQALLLTGPNGSGVEECAKQFALAALCQGRTPPCDTCKSCLLFSKGNHPSFFEIVPDGAEIKIGQVRQLSSELSKEAFFGNRRIMLIRRADRLNRNAANSLLKILEDPPPGIHFILTAAQGGRVQPTIRSRCVVISSPPLGEAEITRKIVTGGERKVGSEDIRFARISEGNTHIFQALSSGKVCDPLDILKAVLERNYKKISEIASTFKDHALFGHGVFILKRLLLDLLLLSKGEKHCIINGEIVQERKVKRLTANPQSLVEFFYIISSLELLPHQANRSFVCESVLLSLSAMEDE